MGRGAEVFGDEVGDLTDGAGPHQARGWQGNTDGALDRVFDLDGHERIESEVREGLIETQSLRLDTQDGSHDIAHGLSDDVEAINRRRRLDLASPVALGAAAFRSFDFGGVNVFHQGTLLTAAEGLPPLRPIDPQGHRLGRTRGEEGLDEKDHLVRREGRRALAREEFGDALIAGDITLTSKGTPVDDEGGKTESLAMMRERIEEGIGGGVVGLGGVAEDARDRGKHHKTIQLQIARALVQEPGSVRFGCEDGTHPFAGQGREGCVIDRHREMEDALERVSGRGDLLQQGLHVFRRTGVRTDHEDLDATGAQLHKKGLGLGRGATIPSREHEMFGPAIDEPLRQDLAEATERAGDQVGALGLHGKGGNERLAASGDEGIGKGDDHLAGVFALRHEAERGIDAAGREGSVRERPQRLLLNEFGDGREEPTRPIFVVTEDRIHRDDVEGGVLPQGPQGDAAVLIDVAFADLDETAELREAREAHGNGLGGERVEDHVDALAIGEFHDRFRKISATRVDHVFHSEDFEQGALRGTARAGDDFRAEMMRDLDRRHADATRTRVNENTLARLQLRDGVEGVPRGHENDGQGRGFFEGESLPESPAHHPPAPSNRSPDQTRRDRRRDLRAPHA